jgi:hypothetical protein
MGRELADNTERLVEGNKPLIHDVTSAVMRA